MKKNSTGDPKKLASASCAVACGGRQIQSVLGVTGFRSALTIPELQVYGKPGHPFSAVHDARRDRVQSRRSLLQTLSKNRDGRFFLDKRTIGDPAIELADRCQPSFNCAGDGEHHRPSSRTAWRTIRSPRWRSPNPASVLDRAGDERKNVFASRPRSKTS